MSTKFPGPYINSCTQDDKTLHYVRDGGFQHTDIGARKSGMVSSIKNEMGIDHVGDATGSPVKSKF
jgi:hypothetical protein